MKQFLPIQAKTNKSMSDGTRERRKSQPVQGQSNQRESIPDNPTRMGYSLSQIPIFPQADAAQTVDAGRPLPKLVRQKMETAFGQDFSDVRVHEGSHVTSIGALAYTQGTDLHFAPGRYQPNSTEGQALIGHELTHVAQKRAGRVRPRQWNEIPLNDESSLEGEADAAGKEAAQGKTVDVGGTNAHIQDAQSEAPIQMKKGSQEEEERRLPLLTPNPGSQRVITANIPALTEASTMPVSTGDEAGSAGLERGFKLPPGYMSNYGLQPNPESEPKLFGHEAVHTPQLTDLEKKRRLEL